MCRLDWMDAKAVATMVLSKKVTNSTRLKMANANRGRPAS